MRARTRCVRSPRSTKHCAGARKLRFGLSAHEPKNDEKLMRPPFELANVFKKGSGMVPGAVWTFSGCQFGAQDGQHGAQDVQDVQLGVQDGPTWRPEPILRASRCASGTTQSAQRRWKMIFRGFESIFFRSFFDNLSLDFSLSFARFCVALRSCIEYRRASLPSTIARIWRLKKRPHGPQRVSSFVRCVAASCCTHGLRRILA